MKAGTRQVGNKSWSTAASKRVFGPVTVTLVLWMTSVLYAPTFFFGFGGGDDSNQNVVGSAGMAVLASALLATVIAVTIQLMLFRRIRNRNRVAGN